MEPYTYIVVLLVAAIVAVALAPKPQVPKAASIEDFDIPTAEEGREIPVVFGTVTVTGPMVTWYGNLNSEPIRKEAGKK